MEITVFSEQELWNEVSRLVFEIGKSGFSRKEYRSQDRFGKIGFRGVRKEPKYWQSGLGAIAGVSIWTDVRNRYWVIGRESGLKIFSKWEKEISKLIWALQKLDKNTDWVHIAGDQFDHMLLYGKEWYDWESQSDWPSSVQAMRIDPRGNIGFARLHGMVKFEGGIHLSDMPTDYVIYPCFAELGVGEYVDIVDAPPIQSAAEGWRWIAECWEGLLDRKFSVWPIGEGIIRITRLTHTYPSSIPPEQIIWRPYG